MNSKNRTRNEAALTLLTEMSDLCKKNQIAFVVGGLAARAVCRNEKRIFPCLDLYIALSDRDRLLQLLKESPAEDRVIEEAPAGSGLYEHAFRYVDTTTTLLDSYEMSGYREKGIHVQVIPLSPAKDGNGYTGPNANGDETVFAPAYLEETEDIRYENTDVRIPADKAAWFLTLFEKDGKKTFPGYNNVRCIVSTTVGYRSFLDGFAGWEEAAAKMSEDVALIHQVSERIDERDAVLNGVMDRLREVYEQEDAGQTN